MRVNGRSGSGQTVHLQEEVFAAGVGSRAGQVDVNGAVAVRIEAVALPAIQEEIAVCIAAA
jgi:hypothetical protein